MCALNWSESNWTWALKRRLKATSRNYMMHLAFLFSRILIHSPITNLSYGSSLNLGSAVAWNWKSCFWLHVQTRCFCLPGALCPTDVQLSSSPPTGTAIQLSTVCSVRWIDESAQAAGTLTATGVQQQEVFHTVCLLVYISFHVSPCCKWMSALVRSVLKKPSMHLCSVLQKSVFYYNQT